MIRAYNEGMNINTHTRINAMTHQGTKVHKVLWFTMDNSVMAICGANNNRGGKWVKAESLEVNCHKCVAKEQK